jgi:hypothetical protein
MARIHRLRDGRVETHAIPAGEPLRLDARGAIPAGADAALLSFVRASHNRVALLVRPPGRALVGGRLVPEVMEITHGDHVLCGELELIVATDARPEPAEAPPGSRCVACCEERPALLACPRCAALACKECWRAAPRGTCFSAACAQPAALDAPLWTPGPADFVAGGEDPA